MVNEDFSVFFNPDEFAVEAWIRGIGVKGILESSYATLNQVHCCKFTFVCSEACVPPVMGVGDSVVVHHQSYSIIEIKPEGTGLLRLVLEQI